MISYHSFLFGGNIYIPCVILSILIIFRYVLKEWKQRNVITLSDILGIFGFLIIAVFPVFNLIMVVVVFIDLGIDYLIKLFKLIDSVVIYRKSSKKL